jgi:MFS family permease
MPPAAPFAAWLIVGIGFFALALSFSVRAVLGLAMPEWEREFGWSREFVSAVAAMAMVVMAILSPFAGSWVDRAGPRLLLSGGLLVLAAGTAMVGAMTSGWMLVIGFGLVGAIGFGLVAHHVVATAIAGAFEAGRGLATGIGTAGSTAGQLALLPILAVALAAGAWRTGVFGIAIACLALAALSYFMIGDRRRATGGVAAEPLAVRLRFLLRSPVFQVLFWSFAICGFTTVGVIETHLLPYAALCGFPPLPSATAYGVLCALNLVGMVGSGWLTDRVNRPLLLGGIYVVRGLSFILLLVVGTEVERLYLFAIIFGLADYSTVPVTASLVASRLGLGVMGLAMGLISAGHALGGAVGAYLGGYLYDATASYDWVWVGATALALFAGFLVFTLRETRGREPVPAAA